MAILNNDDAIPLGPRWPASALRFGSVLMTATFFSGVALAEASISAGHSGPSGQLRGATKDGASELLAQELAGARREIELLQHLSQEHDRAERLDQNLASMRRTLDAQVAKAKDETVEVKNASEAATADLREAAQRERMRAEVLAATLTRIRLKLYAYQAQAAKAADETAELRRQIEGFGPARQSALEDKDRIVALERNLTAAQREIGERSTLLAKVSDEAAQLKKVGRRFRRGAGHGVAGKRLELR